MNKKLMKVLVISKATIINLFAPGLGNIMIGQVRMGLLWSFTALISIILGIGIICNPTLDASIGIGFIFLALIITFVSTLNLIIYSRKKDLDLKKALLLGIVFISLLILTSNPSEEMIKKIPEYYQTNLAFLSGSSMEPTLSSVGILLFKKKELYKRGDIIGVTDEELNERNKVNKKKIVYGKRLIAFEGELIRIKDGKIYIDGKEILEPRIKKIIYKNLGESKYGVWENYRIPKGHVYVLGDNSSNSYDSRYFGALPIENIQGALLKTICLLEEQEI